jgi:hypothetical protein
LKDRPRAYCFYDPIAPKSLLRPQISNRKAVTLQEIIT